jgi:uncharacterized protein (DUF1015 family)
MVLIRSFKGLRPIRNLAEKVASFPYDVINSEEAKRIAEGNPYSFLHVVKPEIDLPENINLYDEQVYQKAKENFYKMIDQGTLVQDREPFLYVYKQKMGAHEQYGLVCCVSADEYNQNKIKKHELTRQAKEDDRTKHVITLNANTGPVFLTYRDQEDINKIIENFVKNNKPEVDFEKGDGVGHTVWVIKDTDKIKSLINEFKNIDALYVADGHHRSASAARAKNEKMKGNPNHSDEAEYNYFLAVLFPASQLKIMDYNRVVQDLNGLSEEEFLSKLQDKFEIIGENSDHSPKQSKDFGMFFQNKWYQIRAKEGSFPKDDPVESLDCAILQNNLLRPILGIDDPRVSNRIDFVGGIRGHKELEDKVKSGKGKVAFKLFPTSITELMSVADADKIMPPKSTWFEPKLRSGLISHLLD